MTWPDFQQDLIDGGWLPPDEAAAARRDLDEALEVLRALEWAGTEWHVGASACPACGVEQADSRGHASDCRLASLLARHPNP